ncbi:MAG: hypothetical protein ACK41E_07315 [Deinococcales bacterium]
MRKWLIVFLTVFGLSAAAQAQDFSIRAGLNLAFTKPIVLIGDARLYATDVARISSGVSLGIIANVNLFFTGSVSAFLSAGPAIVFDFDRGAGFAYVGVNLGLAAGGGTAFIFGLVGGVDYQINSGIGLFADLNLIVVPATLGFLDLGIDFTLSRGLDAYLKFNVGLGFNTFGVGGGLKFAL